MEPPPRITLTDELLSWTARPSKPCATAAALKAQADQEAERHHRAWGARQERLELGREIVRLARSTTSPPARFSAELSLPALMRAGNRGGRCR